MSLILIPSDRDVSIKTGPGSDRIVHPQTACSPAHAHFMQAQVNRVRRGVTISSTGYWNSGYYWNMNKLKLTVIRYYDYDVTYDVTYVVTRRKCRASLALEPSWAIKISSRYVKQLTYNPVNTL